MGTGKTPLRGRLFQQYPKVVLFGKSLSGAASELGLDLSLFCKFFFVDGIDFIRGYTALVSYL